MPEVPETDVLLAITVRKELFDMFEDMFSSDNYHRILMAYEKGDTYDDLMEKIDVSKGTVSNAFGELEEFGLIEEDEDGRRHTLPVLQHPMIQYYYWNEVLENDG